MLILRNKPHESPFFSHMTSEQAASLAVGYLVDHRDDVGRFVLATIIDKKDDNLKIHYCGWAEKWDCWCSYKNELHRFAIAHSISKRPRHRLKDLKIGNYVDINSLRAPGWRLGDIRLFDRGSGQVQIRYRADNHYKVCWVHLDNTQEIDSSGTHIESPQQLHHLPTWLKTRHTLSNVSQQIKSESMSEIAQIAFGGTSNMLDFIVEHANASQLKKIQEIIDKNQMKHEELKKKQNVDIDIENKVIPRISSICELPSDTITYMSGFFNKKDIKSFKSTCYKNGMVCLKEMRKYHVGILDTNQIINDKNEKFVDLIGVGGLNLLNYARYSSSTPYRNLLQQHEQSYNIPVKCQLLFRIAQFKSRSSFCRLGLDRIVRHLLTRKFYLLDKRHLIIYDKSSDLLKAMESNDACIRHSHNGERTCKLVVLKWFDIYFQQLTILQFMAVDATELTIQRLIEYMTHGFITTTEYQTTWHKQFMSYLQKMNQHSTNHDHSIPTLLVYEEMVEQDAIVEIQNLSSYIKQRLIIVFQLNPQHPLFAKSRFATIHEKYELL